MRKLPQGKALEDLAKKLGVSFHNLADPRVGNDEAELQARVINALNAIRAGRLWWVAVLSMIAAILSAAAAWYSVSNCSCG